MHTLKKRAAALLLAGSILLFPAGCRMGSAPEKSFDDFVEALPTKFLSDTDLNLNYQFVNPQDYGFEEKLLELPYATKDDYKESETDTKALLKELDRYSRDSLTKEQRLTYDVLKDYLERSLLIAPYAELDNSYLGSFIGFQAQLPLLLNEYNVNRKNDLDSYFHLLETSGETFLKYAETEGERQKAGCGMAPAILKKVIEQCENFAAGDTGFLVDSMNKKIDAASFLTEEEKTQAKEKNRSLTENDLVSAYRGLKDALEKIEPTGRDEGLWSQPGGKDYYAALLRKNTGIDATPEEVDKYLKNKFSETAQKFSLLVQNNPDLLTRANSGKEVRYSDFTSVEQTVDALTKRAAKDYPDIPAFNYQVVTVPDAMKDNFSPAAYLQSPVDAPADYREVIYVNGEYKQDLFPTIAHEGTPGHMYQNVFFKNQKLPAIRYLIDYNGYSEGWATYVEGHSVEYVETQDAEYAELMQLNQQLTQCIIGWMDIGVHYSGWDKARYEKEIKEYFGDLPQESIDEQYLLILETPTNYLQYYLNGMYYEDLRVDTEKQLGGDFSVKEFHRVLLETGPSSFQILKEQVNAYVEAAKQGENAKAA